MFKGKSGLNITKFLGSGITWVIALLITYLFVQYAFFKLLGVKDKNAPPPVSLSPNQNQNAASPAPSANNFQSINSTASMYMVEGYRNNAMTKY